MLEDTNSLDAAPCYTVDCSIDVNNINVKPEPLINYFVLRKESTNQTLCDYFAKYRNHFLFRVYISPVIFHLSVIAMKVSYTCHNSRVITKLVCQMESDQHLHYSMSR